MHPHPHQLRFVQKPNQIRPHLRPEAPLPLQTLIHDPGRHHRDILVREAIPLVRGRPRDRVHRDGALVRVRRGIVDPGAWQLFLVEAHGVGLARPVVEVRVRFGFGQDGAD